MTSASARVRKTVFHTLIQLCISFALTGSAVFADSPPPYQEFSEFSSGGRYLARVTHQGKGRPPGPFVLTVYNIQSTTREQVRFLNQVIKDHRHAVRSTARKMATRIGERASGEKQWEVEFHYNGYRGGLYVADDGKTVVRLSAWPSPRGALFFYRTGRLIRTYHDTEIPFDRARIKKTVSHYFWAMNRAILDERYGPTERPPLESIVLDGISEDDTRVFLTTVDGQRHEFSLETGTLLSSRAWLFTKEFFQEWERSEQAQGGITDEQKVAFLIDALNDEDADIRADAAGGLGLIADNRAVEALIRALTDESTGVRVNAAQALGMMPDHRAADALKAALDDENAHVRELASRALQMSAGSTEALIKVLEDKSQPVRMNAAFVLGKRGEKRAVAPLIKALGDDKDYSVRWQAAQSLGRLGDQRGVDPLMQALQNDTKWIVRMHAAQALGELGDERRVEPLIKALSDHEPHVRHAASKALEKLKRLNQTGDMPLTVNAGHTQGIQEERMYEVQLSVGAPFSTATLTISGRGLLEGGAVIDYEATSPDTGIEREVDSVHIGREQFSDLTRLITRSQFWSFKESYHEDNLMDATTYTVTVKSTPSTSQKLEDERVHSVSCYGQCPDPVLTIISRIRELWGKEILEVGI